MALFAAERPLSRLLSVIDIVEYFHRLFSSTRAGRDKDCIVYRATTLARQAHDGKLKRLGLKPVRPGARAFFFGAERTAIA
jgi:hypothetical protein